MFCEERDPLLGFHLVAERWFEVFETICWTTSSFSMRLIPGARHGIISGMITPAYSWLGTRGPSVHNAKTSSSILETAYPSVDLKDQLLDDARLAGCCRRAASCPSSSFLLGTAGAIHRPTTRARSGN